VVAGSAAAGVDLLALEATEALEIEAEVIVVGDRTSSGGTRLRTREWGGNGATTAS
jgi:hypothetical protein